MRVPAYSYSKKPVMGNAVVSRIDAALRHWNSLDELRECALSRGCTPAQFQNAVETMGTDPHHIANYLQRHAFVKTLDARLSEAA
jgi:hypothetical protein